MTHEQIWAELAETETVHVLRTEIWCSVSVAYIKIRYDAAKLKTNKTITDMYLVVTPAITC